MLIGSNLPNLLMDSLVICNCWVGKISILNGIKGVVKSQTGIIGINKQGK